MHSIRVINNFVSPEDAIAYQNEARNPSERLPYPDYYADRFGGTALPYNKTTTELNKKYGRKAAEMVKELYGFVNPVYVYKVFMNYTSDPGYVGPLHYDNVGPEPWIEWSAVIYINPRDEWEGGLLHFPNQGYIYDPVQYDAVIFPSAGAEYTHGISALKSGERMSLVVCLTTQPHHTDPDFWEPGDEKDYVLSKYEMD